MTIYIIQAVGTDEYKVGYTGGDPMKRLRQLQGGNNTKLRLIGTIPGGMRKEKAIHKKLVLMGKRVGMADAGSEWFKLTKQDVENILGQAGDFSHEVLDRLMAVAFDALKGEYNKFRRRKAGRGLFGAVLKGALQEVGFVKK